MEQPGLSHVRIWRGDVYIERVPNAWVCVCATEDYETLNDHERQFMIDKALKKGLDSPLPAKE